MVIDIQEDNRMNDQPQKPCARCKESFPLTSEWWPRNIREPYGLHYYCRACHRKISLEAHYDNKDEINARRREKRLAIKQGVR